MIKEKQCKGSGKAVGYGCGDIVPVQTNGRSNRVYGLGISCGCYPKWLLTSKEGQEKINRSRISGVKKIEKTKKKKKTDQKKLDQEQRMKLLSPSAYRSKYLQDTINKIIRLIDKGLPCIASGNTTGQIHAGHYHSVGSNPTLSINLHNIHRQCMQSNSWKGGDERNYTEGLESEYGKEYLEFVNFSLRGVRSLNLFTVELMEINKKARLIKNKLEKADKTYSLAERIGLRNEINKSLGVYQEEYSVFCGNVI